MKKLISFLLALTLIAGCVGLVACNTENGEVSEAVNEQEWQEAVSLDSFDNVTVNYTTVIEGNSEIPAHETEQTVKIAGNKLYRKAVSKINGVSQDTMDVTFEGEEAKIQKKMFLDVLIALVKDKSNYKYDAETGEYRSSSLISVVVYPTEDTTITDKVTVENGVVKFDEKGNLVYFSGKITETVYMGEEIVTPTVTADSVWTVTDYGTTVIE